MPDAGRPAVRNSGLTRDPLEEPDAPEVSSPEVSGREGAAGGDTPYVGVPIWFEAGLLVLAAAVVSFGGFGLFLAVLGSYHAAPALLLGAAGTALLSILAWPRRVDRKVGAGAALPAVLLCVIAVSWTGWNAAHPGHHILVGRDPGVYADTGKWIATHGNLVVPSSPEWSAAGSSVTPSVPGTYTVSGNRVEFQFDHLMPVLLAEADNIGGDGLMFRLSPLLGGIALLAIYAVACRVTRRPWLAVIAAASVALALPQINVSRDTYSEAAVEVVIWAGIWLLSLAYDRKRVGVAVVAGATLAATLMGRIDGLIYLLPLPLLAAVVFVAASDAPRRRKLGQLFGGVALGAAPVAIVGTVDVVSRSGRYYHDLHSDVHKLQLGLVASVVAGVLVIGLWPIVSSRSSGARQWIAAHSKTLVAVVASVVGLAGVAGWSLRPALSHPRGANTPAVQGFVEALQQMAGLPHDGNRTYAEQTLNWFAWYLGPVAVALAIAGAAILLARALRKPDAATVVVLAVAGCGTALYLWNPSIAPDQIWAARRFVPVGFPLAGVLAAAILAAALDAGAARNLLGWQRPVTAAWAVGVLAFPLATTWPVRNVQSQANYLPALEATCRTTGHDAAILTVSADVLSQQITSALRSWCNVPVEVLNQSAPPTALQGLARSWAANGRTLWVLASTPQYVAQAGPGLSPRLIASGRSPHELETTLNRPPSAYEPGTLMVYASRVPA